MLRDDGILVAEQGFWKRLEVMKLVYQCAVSPEFKKNWKFSIRKFLWVAPQYIFLGRYRVFTEEEMKEFRPNVNA